jgi:hypothetical protein
MLPYRFKFPGYILILTGIVLSILYFTVKFRFQMKVFALFSSYLKTRYFTTFTTNFADETIFLLLLSGFSLTVFSREKDELDVFMPMRYRALVRTVIADILFLFLSVLFIYGSGFLVMAIFNIILPFILYLLFFTYMKIKELKKIF